MPDTPPLQASWDAAVGAGTNVIAVGRKVRRHVSVIERMPLASKGALEAGI